MKKQLLWAIPIIAGCLFVGSLVSLKWQRPEPLSIDQRMLQARQALSRKDFTVAETLALEIPVDHPGWPAAMLIAGEAATRLERLHDAATYYANVPLTSSRDSALARFSLGEVLLHTGRLVEAEQAFRDVIKKQPSYVDAHSRLAFILALTGQRFKSAPFLFNVLKSGTATLDELVLLADIERPLRKRPFLLKCEKQSPDDVLVRLGLAANDVMDGDNDKAISSLKTVVKQRPDLIAAQALLGELLLDDDQALFIDWYNSLPTSAADRSDIWFVRGLSARKRGQLQMAARCFWQTLNTFPMHRRANYQLGMVLARLNIEGAEEFSNRSKDLFELSTWLTHVKESEGKNPTAIQKLVGDLESMGRIWEACAWATLSRNQFPNAAWRTSTLSRLSPRLSSDLPNMVLNKNLCQLIDVSSFPEFRTGIASSPRANPNSVEARFGGIRFSDNNAPGLDFVYQNANDESTPGARIQEQTGGGAAVLDFDGDTWPDLYFVQGGEWTHGATSAKTMSKYSDRVFRNRLGKTFDDVTNVLGVREYGFGQSCAIGDINEDGFPDLYIANIGTNVLYLNNGDGTFHRPDTQVAASQQLFTSSAAIADINGDGLADIFDANYVTGAEVYHLICNGQACSPAAFDGVPDRVHLNSGTGQFSEVIASTPYKDAKGLGIVIARLADEPLPSAFVANDQTPNFLLTLSPSDDDSPNQLTDTGFQKGVAYSQDGLLTAAMGIAADDVDGNGMIDFFVTNFLDESNVLYLQVDGGFFRDATRSAGLQSPSVPYVGWGTQFMDADRDGEIDLVLTNGHVDSYAEKDTPPKMRCQFFRNTGDVKFQELNAKDIGPFFDKQFYGRGLSRLDWNQDGLMDFVMVPLREPAALVTNVTSTTGRFVNIRLHGTKSSRDAITAIVHVETSARTWHKQLLAGDGYHASNERFLQFGLGDTNQIDRVTIEWPSGNRSQINKPPVDSTLEVVEGHATATAWQDQSAMTLSVVMPIDEPPASTTPTDTTP